MNNDNGEQMDDDILPEAEQLSGKMRSSTADKNKVNYEVNILDVVKVCRFFSLNKPSMFWQIWFPHYVCKFVTVKLIFFFYGSAVFGGDLEFLRNGI